MHIEERLRDVWENLISAKEDKSKGHMYTYYSVKAAMSM